MARIGLISAATVLAIVGATAAAPAAEISPGPRLGYERTVGSTESFVTTGPDGADLETLPVLPPSKSVQPDSVAGFSWSPDGSSFAFTGVTPRRCDCRGRPSEDRIYVQAVAGGVATEVPGSVGSGFPIFAPDGTALAVLRQRRGRHRASSSRREESSIWLLRLDGADPRRLTPWRDSFKDIPEAFEPSGASLAIIRTVSVRGAGRGPERSEVVTVPLDGTVATPIVDSGGEIAYSPDGTMIAVIRRGENGGSLWVAAADGSGLRQLSEGPRPESSPTWDPSGQRIAFLMEGQGGDGPHTFIGFGNAVIEINADGSCQRAGGSAIQIAHHSPSWLPGPSRGAGPITC